MNLNKKKGFSLVEILIASVVFALIIGAMYTGLQAGQISWKTYGNNIVTLRDARNVLMIMAKELREAASGNPVVTTVPSSVTLVFTRPDVGVITYIWTVADNTISRQGTTIASNISSLSFDESADYITINLIATKETPGGQASNLTLKKKVALRN